MSDFYDTVYGPVSLDGTPYTEFYTNQPLPLAQGGHYVSGVTQYPQTAGTAHMVSTDKFLGGNGLGENMSTIATLAADTIAGDMPANDLAIITTYTVNQHAQLAFIDQNQVMVDAGKADQWVYTVPFQPFTIPPAASVNYETDWHGTFQASAADWLTVGLDTSIFAGAVSYLAPGANVVQVLAAAATAQYGINADKSAWQHVANDVNLGVTQYSEALAHGLVVP